MKEARSDGSGLNAGLTSVCLFLVDPEPPSASVGITWKWIKKTDDPPPLLVCWMDYMSSCPGGAVDLAAPEQTCDAASS